MTAIIIEDWRPMERNTLRGFVRIKLPSNMVVHDVAVHQKDGRAWVSPPGRPQVGRDGVQIKRDGKPQFSPTISFADRDTADRFSDAVLTALRAAQPGALP